MKKACRFLFIILQPGICFTARNLARIFCRFKVYNKSGLPDPPFIICSNHVSHLDGIIISSVIPHKIRWLLTEKHYQNKKMKPIYDAMKLIIVNAESTDRTALKETLSALKNKDVIGIFPEGKRSSNGKLQDEFHPGAAYLSIKSGAPILPIGVKGTFEVLPSGSSRLKRHPISIGFDGPLKPTDTLNKETIQEFTDEIKRKIRDIIDNLPDRK